jgi:hypothetical protein
MSQEPRKATEVLLDLESKVSMLLDIIRAQDLNIKVLSNKLNDVIGRLDKQQAGPPRIIVEAAPTPPATNMPTGFVQLPAGDPERTIPITAESKLPQDSSPQGFRRSSRPETYSGDNAYLPRPDLDVRMPVQLPKGANPPPPVPHSEAIVPPQAINRNAKVPQQPPPMPEMMEPQAPPQSSMGQIPVMQRCVDKNGKSIFLAPVEIVDLSNGQSVFKTRTNGTGKWMASLGIGAYRVTITKQASINKEKLEAVQDIQVDGAQSPLELPMIIIK